jgi:hypothetical protein
MKSVILIALLLGAVTIRGADIHIQQPGAIALDIEVREFRRNLVLRLILELQRHIVFPVAAKVTRLTSLDL